MEWRSNTRVSPESLLPAIAISTFWPSRASFPLKSLLCALVNKSPFNFLSLDSTLPRHIGLGICEIHFHQILMQSVKIALGVI
eukprot:3721606-Amphidinium_carterae.1